jgi:hypothetical protein
MHRTCVNSSVAMGGGAPAPLLPWDGWDSQQAAAYTVLVVLINGWSMQV